MRKQKTHSKIQRSGPRFVALLTIAVCLTPVLADDYHQINGFIGERAAGLAGAYTAISDDPSGAYYNPAGIAFAYDNFISISASTYRETKKEYSNIFGPGQSYDRISRTYIPNFFGGIKNMGGYTFGFSIVSPAVDNYDQSDQIVKPLALNGINSYRNDYTENRTTVMVGPSIAKALGERFSLGASLYYFYDAFRTTSTQLVEREDKTYTQNSIQDRRRTMALLPVLGMQYMPIDALSLGLSLRRHFVTSEQRHKSGVFNSTATSTRSLTLLESTEQNSAAGSQTSAISGPGESGRIPENYELRIGSAYFLSRYSLLSLDLIHSTAYSARQDNTRYDALTGDIYFYGPEVQVLARRATMNYAIGVEHYLTENLAIRLGTFSNYANSKNIDWSERAIVLALRSEGKHLLSTGLVNNSKIYYTLAALDTQERFEYVDLYGYSLGLSWGDARSSITLTLVSENGAGGAQIDQSLLPQRLVYRSFAIYIVASTQT